MQLEIGWPFLTFLFKTFYFSVTVAIQCYFALVPGVQQVVRQSLTLQSLTFLFQTSC